MISSLCVPNLCLATGEEEQALLVLVHSPPHPDLPPCGSCLMRKATGWTREVWKDTRCWWFHRIWMALVGMDTKRRPHHNVTEQARGNCKTLAVSPGNLHCHTLNHLWYCVYLPCPSKHTQLVGSKLKALILYRHMENKLEETAVWSY